MRTGPKISILLLVLITSVPIGALWMLGYSERALTMLVERLPERFGPVERLAVTGVSGTLAGGFVIESLELEHDLAHLRIYDVRARVNLWSLLWQKIRIDDLRVRVLEFDAQLRDLPLPERAPRFLPGLVTLEIPTLEVTTLKITPLAGAALQFESIEAVDARVLARQIRIPQFRAALKQLKFSAQGTLRAARPLQLEGRVQTTIDFAQGEDWLIENAIEGDLESARITGGIRQPFTADFTTMTLRALPPWQLDGKVLIPDLDASLFGASKLLDDLAGELTLGANREGNRLQGLMTAPQIDAAAFAVDFFGRWQDGALEMDYLKLDHRVSGMASTLAGTARPTDGRIALDVTGRWTKARWPLRGATPAVTSAVGRFSLIGSSPYEIAVEGQIARPGLPSGQLTLSGRLLPGRLETLRGELDILDGEVRLQGELAWQPALAWRLSTNVTGINPAAIREELRGSIDAEVELSGRIGGSGNRAVSVIDIELRKLGGRLRDTRVRGDGGLRWSRDSRQADNWEFIALKIGTGGLQLALDGSLSARRQNLAFTLRADDLSVLAPEGRGRLQAEGEIRGTPAAPRVKLTASGRDISLRGIELASLTADIDIDPSAGPDTPTRAVIELRQLAALGRSIERAGLQITGTSADHVLRVEALGKDIGVLARGAGRLNNEGWQQEWSQFDLRLLDDILLALDGRLLVTLGDETLTVAPFCLLGAATICATGERRAEDWTARIDLSRLPIATLLPRPSPRASYEGVVTVSAQLSGKLDGPVLGTARADFRDAALRWQRAGGKQDLIELGSGLIELNSTEEAISGRLQIAAADRGRARGQLRAERSAEDWRDLPLRAELVADSSALALLYLYVPEIDRSAGDLSTDLIIGGTLGAPLVNGVLRLKKGELDFYQINLSLREIDAEARLIDNGFVLSSSAMVGAGRIAAQAELLWLNRQPFGELRLSGKDLLLVDLPEAKITASPELTFKVTGRELKAEGTVRIPFARLAPADLTGAILTSTDEILEGSAVADPQSSFRVTSNLRLELGEAVSVEALGLSARIGGALTVTSTPDGINRGVGELNIAQGKYAALGRLLDVERGRLIFAGGLLEDPAVDLRATKIFPDVKAGVNVRGTLRDPRLSFFSEPALPQSQVVSLILAGGNLESAQGGNTERDALLAQGGAILAQQIGQRIGIDDVGIEQNLANETALVFGKYLSSRLYVSYGVSLAEAINTFKMRYTINDRWTIRTEAGKESSVEVVYTVEKD